MLMKKAFGVVTGALLFAASLPVYAADVAVPDYVSAAVADTTRPAEDTARDADRKPAQVLALTGVKPGDKVVDVGPGGTGYYLRMLSNIVGPEGKAYAYDPTWIIERFPDVPKKTEEFIKSGNGGKPFTNIEFVVTPMAEIKFAEPVDIVFMSLLYHDQHWQKIDIAKMNQAIFAALKPGGTYFIIDHHAEAGSGIRDVGTLHRIDAEVVKQDVLAAGFTLESESDVLRNPADTRKLLVFDESIRGKTDQFIYKFKKPAG
jgi:predicted methyltransferase